MEHLSEEFINEWLERNCLPAEELSKAKKEAIELAEKEIQYVTDETVQETEEIGFELEYFDNDSLAFSYAMFKFGQKYSYTEDIEVRYLKKVYDDGSIHPTFTIVNLPLIEARKEAEKEAARLAAKQNKNNKQ